MDQEVVGFDLSLYPEGFGGFAGDLQGNIEHGGEKLLIDFVELIEGGGPEAGADNLAHRIRESLIVDAGGFFAVGLQLEVVHGSL